MRISAVKKENEPIEYSLRTRCISFIGRTINKIAVKLQHMEVDSQLKDWAHVRTS